ncbi:hypothetical protein QAD02_019084 [Eretmocerus hayati]|uniref:Uncharacterized protein n=1 Tax=Eretmocerus hayati TaxID=131215 RepID=A0ACC2PLP6_9HYME|nr:hypothetical protein QAD02_019084 [Eretmocerus hayati]
MGDATSDSGPKLDDGMQQIVFGWIDYSLFSGLLGFSLLIGFYFGLFSKQDSVNEYLFGGKTMSYMPVAASILASLLSGITFLGIPTEVYFHGSQVIITMIPNILCLLTSAYVFLPIFYDLQLLSSYEYLELRFSRPIRILASTLYTTSLMLYIPIVIYVPSLAFSQVTGHSLHLIAPVFSLICITYTTMGGVKAVVWTDTIQFFFTIGGLITVLCIGINAVGGVSEIFRIADKGGRLNLFNMNPNPFERTTFWSMLIGGYFSMASRFSAGQKFTQRFLAIEKKADIRKAVGIMGLGWTVLNVCVIFSGLVVYAKYHGCDPLKAHLIDRNDQTIPFYVMDVAGHISGLPGVFLAGLVSSALSTMSASLNSLSGIIYNDFIDSWIQESPNKGAKAAKIMKVISVIIGVLTVAMIFVIEHLGTIFEMANSLSSVVDGPLLGLFFLGFFVPWVGKRGALWGGFFGVGMMTWFVGNVHWNTVNKKNHDAGLPTSIEHCPYPLNETLNLDNKMSNNSMTDMYEDEPMIIFKLSFLYFIFLGTVMTMVSAIIVSIIFGENDPSKVNSKHVYPFMRRFLPKKEYTEVPMKDITQKVIKM